MRSGVLTSTSSR